MTAWLVTWRRSPPRTTHTGVGRTLAQQGLLARHRAQSAERTCRHVDDARPVEAERLELLRRRDPEGAAAVDDVDRRGAALADEVAVARVGGEVTHRAGLGRDDGAPAEAAGVELRAGRDPERAAAADHEDARVGRVVDEPTLGEVARPLARVGPDEEAAPRAGPGDLPLVGVVARRQLEGDLPTGGPVVPDVHVGVAGVLAVAVGDDLVVVAELGDRPRLGQAEQLRLPGVEARLEQRQLVLADHAADALAAQPRRVVEARRVVHELRPVVDHRVDEAAVDVVPDERPVLGQDARLGHRETRVPVVEGGRSHAAAAPLGGDVDPESRDADDVVGEAVGEGEAVLCCSEVDAHGGDCLPVRGGALRE